VEPVVVGVQLHACIASGLKDIAYSMAQGSCAATKVDIILKSAAIT